MINRQNYKDVQTFLAYRKRNFKCQDSSIELYRTWLNYALEWAGETPFSECYKKEMSFPDHIEKLIKDGFLCENTAVRCCKLFKYLLNYFTFEDKARYKNIKKSFIDSIRLFVPKDNTKEVLYYSLEDMKKIASLEISNDISMQRTQALACLMFLSGMRFGEASTMPIQCLNLDNCKVYQYPELGVHTKQKKKAVTSLYKIPVVFDVVKKWDNYIRSQAPSDSTWYPKLTARGELDVRKPIMNNWDASYRFVRGISSAFGKKLRQLCELADVDYKHPHALRYGHIHYGLSHAKNMEDVKAVSLNVKHGSMSMTDSVYSRMNIDDVNEKITNMGMEKSFSNKTNPSSFTGMTKEQKLELISQLMREL